MNGPSTEGEPMKSALQEREAKSLDDRIEKAQKRADRAASWAQEARDEATGAESCGHYDRATNCRAAAERWEQDSDVFAATAGRLTAERQAAGGDFMAYPADWTPADQAQRVLQGAQYARDGGNRHYIEGLAYLLDAERSECLGLAP
jgi:hypothetical protein